MQRFMARNNRPGVLRDFRKGPGKPISRGWLLEHLRPRNAAYTGERMKNSAQRGIVERKGTLEFGMRSHMKLKARILLSLHDAAGGVRHNRAGRCSRRDRHRCGTASSRSPTRVLLPAARLLRSSYPPVYYGPGIVVGAWGGHDWRDHRGHDERWRNDRWHDHHDHHH
jgi:hypothetical protein